MNDRPSFVKDSHLLTLDFLKASGGMNNQCACDYLIAMHPDLSKTVSGAIVAWWMAKGSK